MKNLFFVLCVSLSLKAYSLGTYYCESNDTPRFLFRVQTNYLSEVTILGGPKSNDDLLPLENLTSEFTLTKFEERLDRCLKVDWNNRETAYVILNKVSQEFFEGFISFPKGHPRLETEKTIFNVNCSAAY